MAINFSRNVLDNLSVQISQIEDRTRAGMLAAGALIKLRSQNKTPVDTGNLKGSHYVTDNLGEEPYAIEVGCTADYAVEVHEDLEVHHTTGEAKFLEKAITDNQDGILRVIRNRLRV